MISTGVNDSFVQQDENRKYCRVCWISAQLVSSMGQNNTYRRCLHPICKLQICVVCAFEDHSDPTCKSNALTSRKGSVKSPQVNKIILVRVDVGEFYYFLLELPTMQPLVHDLYPYESMRTKYQSSNILLPCIMYPVCPADKHHMQLAQWLRRDAAGDAGVSNRALCILPTDPIW